MITSSLLCHHYIITTLLLRHYNIIITNWKSCNNDSIITCYQRVSLHYYVIIKHYYRVLLLPIIKYFSLPNLQRLWPSSPLALSDSSESNAAGGPAEAGHRPSYPSRIRVESLCLSSLQSLPRRNSRRNLPLRSSFHCMAFAKRQNDEN